MTREEAIEWLKDIKNITENWSQEVAIDMAIEALSAERTGEWVADQYPFDKCSVCGCMVDCYDEWDYCPNCGAAMNKGGDPE